MERSLISRYMTPAPRGIEPGMTLSHARKKMEELKIHHLPVRTGGRVVGILSERDLDMLGSIKDLNMESAPVSMAMISDPYTVSPSTTLSEVAGHMAKNKIGSALVVNAQGELEGIFTYTDALRILSEMTKPS